MQTAVLDIVPVYISLHHPWMRGSTVRACAVFSMAALAAGAVCSASPPSHSGYLYVLLEGGLFFSCPPAQRSPSSLTAHCYCVGWLEDGCC